MISPDQRDHLSRIGRLGALVQHSMYSPVDTTARARATFRDSFLDQVDPNHELPEAERIRRATYARKAHFLRLALKSAQSRRQRAGRKNGGGGDAS